MIKLIAVVIFVLLIGLPSFGQLDNWQNKDLEKDGEFGISTEKAYSELLINKKPKRIIVAVIDSGIDTAHVDLSSVLWTNTKEIPGNGIDDDHNGYIDDVHGWNFTGINLSRDSLVELMTTKRSFFDSLSYTAVPVNYRAAYQDFRKIQKSLSGLQEKMEFLLTEITGAANLLEGIVKTMGTQNPSVNDFKEFRTKDIAHQKLLDAVIIQLPLYPDYQTFKFRSLDKIREALEYSISHFTSGKDSAGVAANYLGHNPDVSYDRVFTLTSTEDIRNTQPFTFHGTHLAGIIAASRNNNTGINGVANKVQIMPLKIYSPIYPTISDENLAEAIRYAADNGASVINLSLGLSESPGKKLVDSAVRYAMKKNVLIVHAAGNSGKDIDGADSFFPNQFYQDGKGKAEAWINVGASGWEDNNNLFAPFSNYGQNYVDVFAPGEKIYSTIPGSGYMPFSGTSMAAPVVAGLAALIMEYYPALTAVEVKQVIINTVEKRDVLKDKCSSGGVVNTYNALKLAEKYSSKY